MSRVPYGFDRAVLREARADTDLTQQALATELRVSREAVRSWEAGRRVPAPTIVRELAAALDVPVSRLVTAPHLHLPADLRRQQGLSAQGLADALSITVGRVREVEDGATLPDEAQSWARLLRRFGHQFARSWLGAADTRELRRAVRAEAAAAPDPTIGPEARMAAVVGPRDTGPTRSDPSLPDPAAGPSHPRVPDPAGLSPVGPDLRSLRERAGRSGPAVARDLDCHSSTVYRVESGRVLPGHPQAWAAAYGTTRAGLTTAWLLAARRLPSEPDLTRIG